MTANAFMSASLRPPLVLVAVRYGARFHAAIERAAGYGVSILPAHLEREARRFAGLLVGARDGEPEFVEQGGVPILEGALAWVATRSAAAYAIGDHTLFVGEVVDLGTSDGQEAPLAFFRSTFTRVEPTAEAPVPIDPWGDSWG
jgi:flavin reductase (DIM6/NTAB) family NADH-FMN oxidoreductase RutF